MKIENRRKYLLVPFGVLASLLASCNPAQQKTPLSNAPKASKADAAADPAEPQRVAEAVLGQQAEIIAHGDLARNGLEYMLVVNRYENAPGAAKGPGNLPGIFVTRAAMVVKDNGKWTEVLRCDEHLKNPKGYLGGSPTEPATGWRLEIKPETQQGLEMKFTPANSEEPENRAIFVGWNSKAKRYQSFDESHERYLAESPMSETPYSIIK